MQMWHLLRVMKIIDASAFFITHTWIKGDSVYFPENHSSFHSNNIANKNKKLTDEAVIVVMIV